MEQPAGWQMVITVFLIASVTATVVSYAVNSVIRSWPVLVVQISMLITLVIYPAINAYLFVLFSRDYEAVLYGGMEYLSYNSVMFFAPLPVCIFVTGIFRMLRSKPEARQAAPSGPKTVKDSILKKVTWFLSVILGGVWFLTATGRICHAEGTERLIILSLFTVYGLIATGVALVAFWIGELLE
jgi:hypothetical protein